jgi:hippurate hydrolase
LQLTVRSYSPEVRKQLHAAIERIANGIAATAGAPKPTVEVSEGTPALSNDAGLAARLWPIFQAAVGADHLHVAKPTMGGEDFSRFGRAGVPILMFRLGSVDSHRLKRYASLGQKAPPLHSPLYYPDVADTLRTGLQAMSAAAIHLLQKPEE